MNQENYTDEPIKKSRRKPNFTGPERLHLARSYVENIEEYNRGFTASTRGDAKHGRQRLLEKWANELTAFGVVERTTIEVEQKLRDYMKKIIGNSKRPHKRPLSPAAELLSTVIPQVNHNSEEATAISGTSNSISDPQTEYADFLLKQHRAATTSSDSIDNSYNAANSSIPPAVDFTMHIEDTTSLQRALLAQQLENARADHALKLVAIENARIEQKLKMVELEKRKLELQRIQQEHDRLINFSTNFINNGNNNNNSNDSMYVKGNISDD